MKKPKPTPNPDHPLVGLLRELRGASGLTQDEAAKRAGVTSQTVYDWEAGKAIQPWETRIKYLKAMAEQSRTARNAILEALGLPHPDEAALEPEVEEILDLVQRARSEPGWDGLSFALKRMLRPNLDPEPTTTAIRARASPGRRPAAGA